MQRIIIKKNTDILDNLEDKKGKLIGEGSEGVAFLLSNNKVLKYIKETAEDYKAKDIITTDDVNIEGFLFPDKLYILNNQVKAYESKYVQDIFTIESNCAARGYFIADETYDKVDFKKLYKAYLVLQKEVLELSKKHILMDDLLYNLLFDGEKLYAIDTLGYKKVKEDCTMRNLEQLDYAIRGKISLYCESRNIEIKGLKSNDMGEFLIKAGNAIKGNKKYAKKR